MKTFVNGKIWQWPSPAAEDAAHTFAQWMTVSDDGEVLGVGSGDPPSAVETEDLQGALVLPGLHDSHIHVSMLGESAEWLDLAGCRSFDDFKEFLRKYDAAYPDKAWVVGIGWAQDELSSSARYPSRQDIDAVIKDRPVILHRACWHIAVVNTKALEIAGVDLTAKSHDVAHGVIDVDENGATGILREDAVQIVEKHANEPSLVYTKLQKEDSGGLPVRVHLTPSIHELGKPTIPLPGACDGLVSCHRMKIFSDGSLGAETAALRIPYKGTENKGILMNSDEELVKKISDATAAGYRVEIHAIGDRATEQVLTALRAANVSPEKRPILTHCQILGEDLITQMREQGVIGNIQPSFTVTDASYVRKRLEDTVLPFSYCWKRMLENGVACAGGSDAPIETCNPFQGIYDAIYRHKPNRPEDVLLPEEQLSFAEALSLYTRGGAFAAMEENYLGQIAPGFCADFVVLRQDVTEDHAALVAPDLVESVWVNGRKTYQRKKMDFGGAEAGSATAARVNKQTMTNFMGRTVALVGAVESHTPTAVVLRTSDGQLVNVTPQPGSDYGSKVVEVIGRVVDSETIQEFKTTLFGDNFDLETYDQFVQLAQGKFRHLFE
ncbi:hypothetical protein BBO99_00003583 [Phytophthora kernoviae]|uniref:Amidohydrolase 3 domain-containing protein n=2 Tax=Phytophthora kernoviae TaxID=325452 RepID=A0A3R7JX21_9STRA|nr:hypothetical protein JM16_003303 [Phytophthora kernoviae]RLN27317.1 hypothetical protein BBI17_003744 [Phytophthora kernoviae]RLN81594.1 hypothetical protein BBO99_00003583 [Phytophthora kernoviae]